VREWVDLCLPRVCSLPVAVAQNAAARAHHPETAHVRVRRSLAGRGFTAQTRPALRRSKRWATGPVDRAETVPRRGGGDKMRVERLPRHPNVIPGHLPSPKPPRTEAQQLRQPPTGLRPLGYALQPKG
jgi:hypothetical protein